MKLLTLNVHGWIEENQLEKIDILARTIAERDYDVVALQEVNQTMSEKIVYADVKEDNYGWVLLNKIAEYTDREYYYHWANSHIGYGKYDEGIGILTKHKLVNTDDFYCTRSHSVRSVSSRKIISSEIEYNGLEMEFYSCHMNLPNCETENMEKNLKTVLKRNPKKILKILMGDFNVDGINNVKDYNKILKQGLYDTYEMAVDKDCGVTVEKNIDGWKNNQSSMRIDYIFSNREIKVLSSKVIFNGENYPIVSDHFGIEVELEI